ncbi:MAG: dihydroxyacetone kinase subunit DhaK [Halanaerobiales bacterium]|nr:dihydroxyacetone kinase subunit DhaK [Halanaerobiales bacterium]
MNKKILNNPEKVVEEMVEGMAMANPNRLKKVNGFNILIRSKKKQERVALISGGGSGHEPAHGGYVGPGMLDAALAGPVFTSPNPRSVLKAIKEVKTNEGVLLIIKNYSGDVMNFKMAAQKAQDEGIKCDYVIVNDDIAINNPEDRRGIAGTIFVHKIAGAAADAGYNLEETKEVANKAINNIKSKGVALAPCYSPGSGRPSFEIGENEMEVGLGIHGEPGVEVQELKSSREICKMITNNILEKMEYDKNSQFSLMINSLGATPLMELNVMAKDTLELLKNRGLTIYNCYVGNFMTSMEMKGASLTLFKLDEELKNLLNHPVDVSIKL